jgi:hypothetical protein
MPFPRPSSPRALWADMRAFARQRSGHEWIAAAVALTLPPLILGVFVYGIRSDIVPPRQVIYVESWSANRTDAEILADQKKEEAEAEAAQKQRRARPIPDGGPEKNGI